MTRSDWIAKAGSRGRSEGEMNAYDLGANAFKEGIAFDVLANTHSYIRGLEYEAMCDGYRCDQVSSESLHSRVTEIFRLQRQGVYSQSEVDRLIREARTGCGIKEIPPALKTNEQLAFELGAKARQEGTTLVIDKTMPAELYESLWAGYTSIPYPRAQRVKDLAVLDWAITNKMITTEEPKNAALQRIFAQAVKDLI